MGPVTSNDRQKRLELLEMPLLAFLLYKCVGGFYCVTVSWDQLLGALL